MLRPATPLSVLLFASFILLVISVISTPIIRGIPLARYQGVNFGVFGWCKDSGECSSFQVGWNTDQALPGPEADNFSLSPTARHSLSSLLIVHPVAAFCNLVVLALAVAAHLHSPSHSARYLLGLLILLLPTLLMTLLAFLVDILLFVPHLQWGGWIVLASTILIAMSGVVTCAMRRTLVSRKARKKRIAENAEMSGANYYANLSAQDKMMPAVSTESRAPMVNGTPGADHLPAFATYAHARKSEERYDTTMPLDSVQATSPIDSPDRYYGPRSRSHSRTRPGHVTPVQTAADAPLDVPEMPVAISARGAFGPPRGRGAYAPRGAPNFSRGGMPSRGPPPSAYGNRGGYPGRGRGSYGPPPGTMGMIGGRPPPPPGYDPQTPGHGSSPYDQPQELPTSPTERGLVSVEAYSKRLSDPPSPSPHYGPELPAGTVGPYGSRIQSPAQRRQSPYGARTQPPHHSRFDGGQYDHVNSTTVQQEPSIPVLPPHEADTYIPPRADWNSTAHDAVTRSPHSPPLGHHRPRVASRAGSEYVEDVDPRFAEQPPAPPMPLAAMTETFEDDGPSVPRILAPGYVSRGTNSDAGSARMIPRPLPQAGSYEDLPGARSPVESETSNFTSISQRPMNPNWQPGHGGEFNYLGPPRKPVGSSQRQQDVLFANNPDFEIPGIGMPGRSGRGGYGPPRGGRMAGRALMRPPPPSVLDGLDGNGRYPSAPPPMGMSDSGHANMREI